MVPVFWYRFSVLVSGACVIILCLELLSLNQRGLAGHAKSNHAISKSYFNWNYKIF